jgi:hypothetical protein
MPGNLGVDLRADELAAGTEAGFVLFVDNLNERPRLELSCQGGETRKALSLAPGEPSNGAALNFAGAGALYLSLDPGAVGYPGCQLAALVKQEPEGRSRPLTLGRVVSIPRLEQFTLTTELLAPSTYAGVLKGRDLEMVAKTGWDAQHGLPVEAIPTPTPGQPAGETLQVPLAWPAPAPHAPLYIWLRGEQDGRKTAVTY